MEYVEYMKSVETVFHDTYLDVFSALLNSVRSAIDIGVDSIANSAINSDMSRALYSDIKWEFNE